MDSAQNSVSVMDSVSTVTIEECEASRHYIRVDRMSGTLIIANRLDFLDSKFTHSSDMENHFVRIQLTKRVRWVKLRPQLAQRMVNQVDLERLV